jgi:hypothetical protein
VTNNSGAFLRFWEVAASIFDAKRQFLGHTGTNGNNLGPHKSVTKDIHIFDVDSSLIATRELKLGGVVVQNADGERLDDADKYFTLKEVK